MLTLCYVVSLRDTFLGYTSAHFRCHLNLKVDKDQRGPRWVEKILGDIFDD